MHKIDGEILNCPISLEALLNINLHKTLHFAKLQGVNFKYEKDLFQTPPKNTQIRQFRSRPLWVFFHETLRFLKCVRAGIKHDNSLFKEVPA